MLDQQRSHAIDAVREELRRDSEFEELTTGDLAEGYSRYVCGWRFEAPSVGSTGTLDVVLPRHFPFDPPAVFLPAGGKELALTNPHVGSDGKICIFPDSTSIDASQPAELVRHAIQSAVAILIDDMSDDFRDEFLIYWALSEERPTHPFYLIDSVESLPDRPVVGLSGARLLIGRTRDSMVRWAENTSSKPPDFLEERQCLVLRREKPLLPSEYPADIQGLREMLTKGATDCAERLDAHLCESSRYMAVLIIQETKGGKTLAGILTKGLSLAQDREAIKGFRPGRIPQELLFRRAQHKLSHGYFSRCIVQRVDSEWIHSRGGTGVDLSDKRIALIGCGSIGGYVAHLLARAGVGEISLIDPDHYRWENAGRHVLGVANVGKPKAEALAENLRRELPHLSINPINKDWRDWVSSRDAPFENADLIVSTAATWSCEQPLNLLARCSTFPTVLFGWLEPYALAGHVLTVASNGGCLQCGMNPYGEFENKVSVFSSPQLTKEPGGCTYYQEYGPVQMMPVVALIAETAIANLETPSLESGLSTYISSEAAIQTQGGELSEAWGKIIPNDASRWTYEQPWPKKSECQVCHP
ncbi:MAG: hypothetical protein GY906_34210 [bacterium]|nr:hypothetical protein [bacterium]